MKIEDILNHIIYVSNNEKCCCVLEKEEAKVLLDYITTLQRKEYNNSKAIEYIKSFNYGMPYTNFVKKDDLLNILEKGE